MIVYKELSSVEADLGFPAKTLYGLSNNLSAHYREVKLPKRDGSFRTLNVPDEILSRVQRAIADKLLSYEPISTYATAYRIAGSVCKNAVPHVGKAKLLKLDIAHFFDSVLYSTVKENAFPKEKYAEKIRVLLAMLCYCGEVLPQGAPSSPMITNIIMRDFDEAVGKRCRALGVSYTRYCDDMTFSGDFDEGEIVPFIRDELRKRGFFLNEKKTAVVPFCRRQIVTGVVVNEKLNISADYKRKIRQEVFFLRKFGVADHLRRTASPFSEKQYLMRLLGRINYVLQISPDDAKFLDYKEAVIRILKEAK
ncbi:MAG: RNA-directed DNA polymerase [Clostridia bacterium]|nr:RNA-directed DNA polymerase [Clostridia bacterium]